MSCPLWHVCAAVVPPFVQVASPGRDPGGAACTAPLSSWDFCLASCGITSV